MKEPFLGKNVYGKETLNKSLIKNKRKGQVSIFVILGLVIVIIAVITSYLQNEDFRKNVQEISFRGVTLSEQAQGVVNYVNNCIRDIAKEGILAIGEQGGYITIPREISTNPRAYLQFSENIKIPYWLYSEDIVNYPSLADMEAELEMHIEERFDEECGFGVYEEIGYDIPVDRINVDVSIDKGEVDIDLASVLDVDIKGDVFSLDRHVFVSIPSRLNEFYEMATEIIERERLNAPLEFNTMNLISLWSKDDDSGIPKISGFDFSCRPATYLLPSVRTELIDRISEYTSYLQVQGTNLQNFGSKYYSTMVLEDTFVYDHGDVNIQFNYYEGWPFILDINPREGLLLKSNVLKIGLPIFRLFCFNSHDFRYDMIYPVSVDLEADGELFRFPIEVFIDNNYGRRNAFGERVSRGNVPELFCNENHKKSEEIVVKAYDNFNNNEELEGVTVVYRCGINECVMGEIKENKEGIIEFRDKFPLCSGGLIELNKDGYGSYKIGFDTLDSGEQSISANLEPYRGLNLKMNVIELDGDNNVVGNRDIGEDEVVVLQLNRINEEFGGFDENLVVSYDGKSPVQVELVPGRYKVVADLILNEKTELLGGNIGGIVVDGQSVDSMVLGHVEYDDLYLREGDLLNENVMFKVFDVRPRTVGDLVRVYDMEEIVDRNRNILEPEFS